MNSGIILIHQLHKPFGESPTTEPVIVVLDNVDYIKKQIDTGNAVIYFKGDVNFHKTIQCSESFDEIVAKLIYHFNLVIL